MVIPIVRGVASAPTMALKTCLTIALGGVVRKNPKTTPQIASNSRSMRTTITAAPQNDAFIPLTSRQASSITSPTVKS